MEEYKKEENGLSDKVSGFSSFFGTYLATRVVGSIFTTIIVRIGLLAILYFMFKSWLEQ